MFNPVVDGLFKGNHELYGNVKTGLKVIETVIGVINLAILTTNIVKAIKNIDFDGIVSKFVGIKDGRVGGNVVGVLDDGNQLFRKTSNTGDFNELSEAMQLKNVKRTARKAGVGLDRVKARIVRDPKLVGSVFLVHTDGYTITLYPDAFKDKETLVKTIGHERIYIYQIKTFGKPTDSDMGKLFEKAAYESEEMWWQYYLKGRL